MPPAPAYQGKSIAVYQEEVSLPNGTQITLDIVRHPGAAAIVPFISEDEILLIRQYRYAAGGEIYEVPAGKLDAEPPECCAARELEEETGYRAERLVALGDILTTPGFTDERIHLFAAFDLVQGKQALEADEVIEVARKPLAEALQMVWDGRINDAKSALALLKAAQHLGKLS